MTLDESVRYSSRLQLRVRIIFERYLENDGTHQLLDRLVIANATPVSPRIEQLESR